MSEVREQVVASGCRVRLSRQVVASGCRVRLSRQVVASGCRWRDISGVFALRVIFVDASRFFSRASLVVAVAERELLREPACAHKDWFVLGFDLDRLDAGEFHESCHHAMVAISITLLWLRKSLTSPRGALGATRRRVHETLVSAGQSRLQRCAPPMG